MIDAEQVGDLDAVVGDAPVAVLVVDLAAARVVHANDVARQLAPDVPLPVPLERWSDAAVLRDPDGVELSDSEHPLTRLLRDEPVPGQRVSAQRRSEMGEEREPLWVVGLPMDDAPMLAGHALVAFLSVREHGAPEAVEALAGIRDRAVLATGLSFTVADAHDPDLPLVWVNPAFSATTGYGLDEAVGRNCRFLQGPDTDRAEVARVRAALERREAVTATLLNYRRDGLAFWNQVTMSPIFDGSGEVSHYVGVQSDVSSRIEADRQRDAALVAEQEARAGAEAAQARLRLMAEASESLTGELDVEEARTRLLQLLVPALADVAVSLHLDGSGAVVGRRSRHRDPARDRATEAVADRLGELAPDGGLVAALLGGRSHRLLVGEELAARLGGIGVGAALVVPLPGRRGVRDVVVQARLEGAPPYTVEDVELAVDLGRRAGLILDNLRLYGEQALIARTLQRSLLPQVPVLSGTRIDARYLPGADAAEVGGDFYEVIGLDAVEQSERASDLLPGVRSGDRQSFGLAVGDVSGHDVYAAAAMGQLKGILRATASTQQLMPAAVLEHVDRLLPALNVVSPVASMLFAHFEPLPDDRWRLTVSSAGHPPPLLRHPDGRTEYLDPADARGPVLGFGTEARGEATVELEAGTTVVAFTDGLVERRGEVIDVGLERLRAAVEGAEGDVRLSDHLVAELVDGSSARRDGAEDADDVVIVAVHLDGRRRPGAQPCSDAS